MSTEFEKLVDVVAKLRSPEGCPWDREQTHRSILPCLLDEAYEFFEAVDANSTSMMQEELGDLLLQVVLHAQMASERSEFTVEEVAATISEKLVRRHPHVFGDVKVADSREVIKNWEAIKSREKGKESRKSSLDGVPAALPALFRAEKIQNRAARVGFDWPDVSPVLEKVEEEFLEFKEAIQSGDLENAVLELGDILFALANVARHKNISAEDALRRATAKFERRFRYVEDTITSQGKQMRSTSLEEMDRIWEESKKKVG